MDWSNAQLLALAEGEGHARWVMENHVSGARYGGRTRCVICDTWWPCDLVGLAALAVLRTRERNRLLAAITAEG